MLVLTSLLFVACGKVDYSNTYLSSSHDYIEVFVGEEKNLKLTIENPVGNMSKLVTYSSSSDVCTITETSHKDYSTSYTIVGVEGGSATISFVTVEGAVSKSVDVVVRKYSENFSATKDKLFITEQNEMIPSKTDFVFDENVSECLCLNKQKMIEIS